MRATPRYRQKTSISPEIARLEKLYSQLKSLYYWGDGALFIAFVVVGISLWTVGFWPVSFISFAIGGYFLYEMFFKNPYDLKVFRDELDGYIEIVEKEQKARLDEAERNDRVVGAV